MQGRYTCTNACETCERCHMQHILKKRKQCTWQPGGHSKLLVPSGGASFRSQRRTHVCRFALTQMGGRNSSCLSAGSKGHRYSEQVQLPPRLKSPCKPVRTAVRTAVRLAPYRPTQCGTIKTLCGYQWSYEVKLHCYHCQHTGEVQFLG